MNNTFRNPTSVVLGNTANLIMNAMRSSRGRYFGLITTQGAAVNGRYLSETPCYVNVFDRNANRPRKFAKRSLAQYREGVSVIR